MRWLALLLLAFSLEGFSEEKSDTVELIGHLGGRAALMQLYTVTRPDGSARVAGDYLLLATMQQRYLQGERSKQLGVTFLNEGNTPILYGRPPTATLQGTWSGGTFKGNRFGPAGQQREQFEFSEKFPSMDGYSANLSCDVAEGRYQSSLVLAVENGKLKGLEWRSKVSPGQHSCLLQGLEQQPFSGGLRFAAGRCRVTLRELGEFVRVTAEDCAAVCGSQAYLEPLFVDRRGDCQLIRPVQR
jgi:hypothetical protein